MFRKLFYFAAAIWALLAVVLLISGLSQGEARMGAELLMTFLGFPTSLIASEFVIRVFPAVGAHLFDVYGPLWQYLLEWGALFAIGVLQWFVLPHWFWHKWHERRGFSSPGR